MVKSLQSGLILSTLLLWTSQQVGTTFGEFTSVREDNSEIKACRVFPSQIESQLALLADHLERAASLKGRLIGATLTRAAIDTTLPAPVSSDVVAPVSPAIPSTTDDVYAGGGKSGSLEITADFSASLQLEAAADGLSARISELSATIQQLQQQLALNQSIWQELAQELAAATAVIHGLLTSLNDLEPNCAEITQTTLLDRIADLLKGSGLLSGPLRGTLQEILSYLRTVHQSDLSISSDGFAAVAFASPFAGRSTYDESAFSDPVGGEDLAYFESVQASLESAIAGLTSEISGLEAQRAQLLAQAEAQRLAEIERVKLLEEQKAKEEAEQAAKDPVNPDETADPQQPGEEQPGADEPTDGEVPPTVGDSGEGDVQPPADDQTEEGDADNDTIDDGSEDNNSADDDAADDDTADEDTADEDGSSDEQPASPDDSTGQQPSADQPNPPADDDSVALPPDAPGSNDTPVLESPLPPAQTDPTDDLVLTKPEDELPVNDDDLTDDEDENDDEDEDETQVEASTQTAVPSPVTPSKAGE
ncbi:hypothetical protein M0651_22575 [Paenibacillus sp. MBLB2552]|uniref:Uncharacterized protein n=1 Tax=Paenibacillus mellifer TaxID=2937794 RepID=A0A9X1Y3U6_9BACL|nr:hypothetical protein [Paenibacillus mellifer]MCK8489961.1 hypothetical protein [Paenibacillus mellifer]